ncbi:DUF72 domain-containing protein [Paenibacillus cymbidii]|uniref:DUF72 domain-containing protein n=1 Tax=Paenibacillus cymbidii TaxID=1639034 RepID=UPI001080ABF9|nr:DUF72 domain-containing protein [Paenibacillus cymbidii]
MVKIGLAGWGDHNRLYSKTNSKSRLKEYSEHFQVVEVDSSFYALHNPNQYEKWVTDTPSDFGFIIKAFRGLTGHDRGSTNTMTKTAMFHAFKDSIFPASQSGKLIAVLFQFPPWFACNRDSVQMLRLTKDLMGHVPVALEFRNQTWYTEEMRDKTLEFMKQEGWIHSICDEPQAGVGSVPTVLEATNRELTIVRMHGRNVAGWKSGGQSNWRDVRYLYDYNIEELIDWRNKIEKLQQQTNQIYTIFNNNSGGHAAANAKQLMELFNLKTKDLLPIQVDLFDL